MYAGLGVYVPFGNSVQYDNNWIGRYNATEMNMMTFSFNPSLALKLNEKFSIALGVSAQYMDATFQKAADFGILVGQSGNTAFDGVMRYTGTDWGYGWNLGAYWEVNEATRLGLAYRSKVDYTLSGTAQWRVPGALAGVLVAAGYKDGNATTKITTPDSMSLNAFHQLNDKIAVMADWTHTWHSKFDQLALQFSTGLKDSVVQQNWKDTDRFSVGMNYALNDTWLLRTGLEYDKSPVPGNDMRIAALPDGDRMWYSVGANYKFNKATSVDVAYSYVKVANVSMNNVDCNPATCTSSDTTTQADFKSSASLLGVQLNHRF